MKPAKKNSMERRKARRELALSRGFDLSEKPKQVVRVCALPTELKRSGMLEEWNDYVELFELGDSEYLDSNDFQKFVEFWVKSRTGVLCEKLTLDTVKSAWCAFVGAYRSIPGKMISEKTSSEVLSYIRDTLDLSRKKRTKNLITGADITILLDHLWRRDHLMYSHERVRVQQAFFLCLQEGSGQRGGTFVESGCYRGTGQTLWYKDVKLYLKKRDDDSLEFFLKIGMRFRKNSRDLYADAQDLTSAILTEQPLHFRNGVLYFLALALNDKAIKGYDSLEDLLRATVPTDYTVWEFKWNSDVLELPILQMCNQFGPTREALTYSSIHGQIVALGHRAGYVDNITMHGVRRAFVTNADKSYSAATRNHIAGHSGNTFELDYQSKISEVDGQALMNNLPARSDHIELLRGLLINRRGDLPQSLPPESRVKLESSNEWLQITSEIENINGSIALMPDDFDLLEQRQKLYSRRFGLRRKTLSKLWREWINLNYDKEVSKQLERHKKTVEVASEPHFEILRKMMPERDRLAEFLFSDSPLRAPNDSPFEDIVRLCGMSYNTLYRPGEEPIAGKCPFNSCGKPMEQLSKQSRTHHLHSCHKSQLQARDDHRPRRYARGNQFCRYPFTEFCYLCNIWVLNKEEWYQHCESHLQKPPVFCGVLTVNNLLVRTGLCPFCLNDGRKSSIKRFQHWIHKKDQIKHIKGHLSLLHFEEPCSCPHPSCASVYESADDMMNHFEDIHKITAPHNNGDAMRTRKAHENRREDSKAKRRKIDATST